MRETTVWHNMRRGEKATRVYGKYRLSYNVSPPSLGGQVVENQGVGFSSFLPPMS